MPTAEPAFIDIAWAVALRDLVDYNKSYDDIMKEEEFLEKIRRNPEYLTYKEIESILLKFLNDWGCRITKVNYSSISKVLREFFIKNNGRLYLEEDISTFDFDVNESRLEGIFKELDEIKDIGPTSVSKILHITNPCLFVMWDMGIAKELGYEHSTKGYFEFLKKMQKYANNILRTFKERFSDEKDLEDFFYRYFKLKRKCTLAKFLDEYNWAKHTKKWKIPPEWDVGILEGGRR
jgi:hypothetical protein